MNMKELSLVLENTHERDFFVFRLEVIN